MADVLRSNEGLRAELAKSQKRIIELRDTLAAQQKIIADLQASLREGKEDTEATEGEQPLSWFASLLRKGKLGAKKPGTKRSGCQSVSCCLSLLSKWAMDMGRFLLTGIWDFFWDPVGWWQGTKGSLLDIVSSQLQVLSRLLGMLLFGVYLNLIAWILFRIRSAGAGLRRAGMAVWRLPFVALVVEVFRWGVSRALAGVPESRPDRTAQLLQKVEELTRLVRQQQPQPPRVIQRPVPATPAAGVGRPRRPCPNCGRTGHTLVECREPKRCLRCRSTKHLARDCPQVHSVEEKVNQGRSRVNPPPPMR